MAKQQHRRNLDADPYIIQARCEMAAYVYLRPITWRLELVDDLSTFSDFIAVRTDLDGEERLRVFENDPSDWAYCFVVEGPPPSYHLCGWLWATKSNSRISNNSVKIDDQRFSCGMIKVTFARSKP